MNKKTVEKNDKKYVISFLDENLYPCEEKDAYMVSISEYDKDNNFIQNTLGTVERKKDSLKTEN